MSNNLINPQITYRDLTGKVRANGLLYFYVNNTTTLTTVYSDESLTIPQANPYTLDAYGRVAADRAIKFTSKIRVKETNSDGSSQVTTDDVLTGSGDISVIDQYKVTESSPQAMTVAIKAGRTMSGETLIENAQQVTTSFTAPTVNPRIDLIVINRLTGVYSIIAGSEAASPVPPAITAGSAISSEIRFETTSTAITEAMISDKRTSGAIEPSNANTTETLTNKTIGDTNTINAQDDAFTIDDAVDATKQIDFDAAGTANTRTTIASSQTDNRTMTIPDATDTFVGKATTDILSNKTIVVTNNTVTTAPSGNLTATELNSALSELQTDIDTHDHSVSPACRSEKIGKNALASIDTSANRHCQAFGEEALNASTTGARNCAFGRRALAVAVTDSANSAFGYVALTANNGGSNNTAIGSQSLPGITTGNNNTALGADTATSATTGSNNTSLGFQASPTGSAVSNEFTLGNSSVATLRCQVTSITALSDKRDKENIKEIKLGLDFINQLLPVEFDWNMRDGAKVGESDTGFIAQDLQKAQENGNYLPGLVYESNPEKLEASYGKLLPVIVKAIQELSEKIDNL